MLENSYYQTVCGIVKLLIIFMVTVWKFHVSKVVVGSVLGECVWFNFRWYGLDCADGNLTRQEEIPGCRQRVARLPRCVTESIASVVAVPRLQAHPHPAIRSRVTDYPALHRPSTDAKMVRLSEHWSRLNDSKKSSLQCTLKRHIARGLSARFNCSADMSFVCSRVPSRSQC